MSKLKCQKEQEKKSYFFLTCSLLIFLLLNPLFVYAGPQSTTYELKEFGFGAGGVASASSTTYSLSGLAGEIDLASTSATNYTLGAGLTFTLQADVPAAPSFTNPGSTYDRLSVTLSEGDNPPDAEYAFAITDDDWVTTKYIQSDYTVGSELGAEDWLLYSGGQGIGWGGSGGFYVTGLKNNTVYKVKAKARQGDFTETRWSNDATQTTLDPTLTFNINSADIAFANLNEGNSYTDATKNTTLTTSTNAYNGYIVYGREIGPLTHTVDGSKTIADYAGTNAAPTSWTGTGFGYTTDDSSLTGGTADRFTLGGPNFAGFVTNEPGDPVADHEGPVTSPIVEEEFTVSYRVTAPSDTTAGTYQTIIEYIITPTY